MNECNMDIFEKLTCGAKFKTPIQEIKLYTNERPTNEIKLEKNYIDQIYCLRKKYKINVYGTDIPGPIVNFEIPELVNVIQNLNKLGYTNPTPVQMQTLPIIIDRREALICAPTGSGKTAAFLLPLYMHLQITNIKCEKYLNGKRKFHFLLSTPNRLNLLFSHSKPLISLDEVEWLVLDESDRLFETEFRDQLTKIFEMCTSPTLKRAMFSATYSRELDDWCKENMYNHITVCVGARNVASESVKQELYFAGNEAGKIIGLKQLIRQGWKPPVLIFVQSRERAQQLYEEIRNEPIHLDVMHSQLPQIKRDSIVHSFRHGEIWTLICTDLLSRGLDFKDVNLVINFDFPPNAISYIHRIGRTGRAGKMGHAITFFTHEDIPYLKPIYEIIKRSSPETAVNLPKFMEDLKEVPKNLKRQMKKHALIRPKVGENKNYSLVENYLGNSKHKKSQNKRGKNKKHVD